MSRPPQHPPPEGGKDKMTLCREWTLVKYLPGVRQARPMFCRSWTCEECAPRRRAQLMAKAAAGEPTRFITLTINPRVGTDPDDRLRILANAWRNTVKRMRRLLPKEPINYLCVVEATKAGEPHLHILFRGPYINQRWLSDAMSELADSPIVDIRRIRSRKEVIAYVAKYVTKEPHHFGTSKRYWSTSGWEPPVDTRDEEVIGLSEPWQLARATIYQIIEQWAREGYAARRDGPDLIIGFFIDDPP